MTSVAEEQTHYEVLGVEQSATEDQIKRAFRQLMRTYHPDVYGPEGTAISARISASYGVISDVSRRAEYDEELQGGPEEEAPDPDSYEEEWGDAEEWAPEEEALDPEVEDDVPLGDVEVEEDTRPKGDGQQVEDEPGTTQTEPAATDPAKPEQVRYRYPGQRAVRTLVVGALGLIVPVTLALSDWSRGPEGLMQPASRMWLALGAGVVLGLVLGLMIRGSDRPRAQKGRRAPKPPAPAKANAVSALLVVALLLALVVFLVPADLGVLGAAGAALVIAAATVYVWVFYARLQKRLNSFVAMPVLRESNVFGRLPGGVEADLLDRDLGVLVKNEALRIFRVSEEGKPFTHVLIVGAHVALVRAVIAGGGTYRWSGPSLLRDQAGFHPQEVMRGPYEQAVGTFEDKMPEKTVVRSWLFVYTPDASHVMGSPSTGLPRVAAPTQGLSEVRDFLDEARLMVDHERVVEAALAANS